MLFQASKRSILISLGSIQTNPLVMLSIVKRLHDSNASILIEPTLLRHISIDPPFAAFPDFIPVYLYDFRLARAAFNAACRIIQYEIASRDQRGGVVLLRRREPGFDESSSHNRNIDEEPIMLLLPRLVFLQTLPAHVLAD